MSELKQGLRECQRICDKYESGVSHLRCIAGKKAFMFSWG